MRNSTGLKNDIRRWLRERGDTGAKILSIAEWKRRGERYGDNAAFIMIIEESPLYATLNYGEDGWKAQKELNTICQRHGFWYEQGYYWSLAFYEI